METNPLNILTGILTLFVVSYFLIALYAALYIKYVSKAENPKKGKFLFSIGIAALAWISSTFLAIWIAASAGIMAFALVSMIFIFSVNLLISEKFFGIKKKQKLLFSLVIAVILNPAWLSLVGVI